MFLRSQSVVPGQGDTVIQRAVVFTDAVGPNAARTTARFLYVRPGDLKSPRDVEIRVTARGQPSDHAWHVALKTSLVVRSEPKRIGVKGVALKGLGRDIAGVWVGVFNPDPELPAGYEVVVAVRPTGGPVRKSSPFAPPGHGR